MDFKPRWAAVSFQFSAILESANLNSSLTLGLGHRRGRRRPRTTTTARDSSSASLPQLHSSLQTSASAGSVTSRLPDRALSVVARSSFASHAQPGGQVMRAEHASAALRELRLRASAVLSVACEGGAPSDLDVRHWLAENLPGEDASSQLLEFDQFVRLARHLVPEGLPRTLLGRFGEEEDSRRKSGSSYRALHRNLCRFHR